MPRKRGERSTFKRVRFHLRRLARRTLNDLAKAGHPIPERSALTDALAAYVSAELSRLVYIREPGGSSLGRQGFRYLNGDGAVRRVAASAARYTLEHWSADYMAEVQRRASLGGQRSRRGPSKATADNLAALAAMHDGLTHQQRADALQVSLSTEKRLWTQYQHQRALETAGDVSEPQEAPGAPSGLWRSRHADQAPEPVTWIPAQRRYGRRIYPGERV
jgi:hypothetical protein